MLSVLAHRGASAACRENTIEAFRTARRQGADGVELDVRRSADGVLVVHHDAALPDGRALAEVAAADLPEWLPRLEAALDECKGLIVDAEIKNLPIEPGYDPDEAVGVAVARLMVARAMQATSVVSSFSMATIDAARAAEPTVATGWLTLAAYDQHQALELTADRGHSALQPRHEAVTAELVNAAHDRGLEIHAWTVDDGDRIRWLDSMGVDAVITNLPDVAVAALGRRGGP